MTYLRDPNTGAFGHLLSDRYILLQTYTIKNLKNEPLTGLEFYQFMHSHGANEYAPRVNSTYCDAGISDPLVAYIPYNSVHQTGNFRYDITQWNTPPYGNESHVDHVDYVGFSSAVEPDWVDNEVYDSIHDYVYDKRTYGSHVDVENRCLNNDIAIYLAEVGGAMGWAMGSLDPNETTSMTIAFMMAPYQDSSLLTLAKSIENPQECYDPGDTLTYLIEWENIGPDDAENAVLTDYLPAGLTYEAGSYRIAFGDPNDPNQPPYTFLPPDPNYDSTTHSYQWDLGIIPGNSSRSVELTLTVNEYAPPGMTVRNEAVLETSLGSANAYHYTPICCWDQSGIIYVDCRAIGANVGTNWQNAYTDLQSALARAAVGCGTEIWVAQGTYDPGRQPDKTFAIPAGVSVYGGFIGNETLRDQRNWKVNKTVLTGAADTERNSTVVTMGDETLLDGFTVTGAANPEGPSYGVYASGADFSLVNCVIENNDDYGIRASSGNVALEWCYVRGNKSDGIRHDGAGCTLSINNCWIMKNMGRGIYCGNSTPVCRNSIVSESDLSEAGNAGIRAVNPTSKPVLYNCTFAHNTVLSKKTDRLFSSFTIDLVNKNGSSFRFV